MAWLWTQDDGSLWRDGVLRACGYSGWDDGDGIPEPGEGRNDPRASSSRGIGPIPVGRWKIVGPPIHTDTHGPYVLRLLPEPGTETFGRSGFLCHGDSKRAPGTASHGCIVLPQWARALIWTSGDRDLVVEATHPTAPPEVA